MRRRTRQGMTMHLAPGPSARCATVESARLADASSPGLSAWDTDNEPPYVRGSAGLEIRLIISRSAGLNGMHALIQRGPVPRSRQFWTGYSLFLYPATWL
jgi:hypothetical protein